MYTWELPYMSVGDDVKTVTTTTSITLNKSAVIHNTGPNVLYFSGKGAATTNSPELAVGEKSFPRVGTLYLLSAGSSVLKIEYIDALSE